MVAPSHLLRLRNAHLKGVLSDLGLHRTRVGETTTKRGLTAAQDLACGPAVAYASSDGSGVVYGFHIALRGVRPRIWRRVELTAGSSLADLQRVIQLSLGWSDEYQHRFCICNHYLGASRPGGPLFFGDPEAMTLSQFIFPPNERFTYEYNFFDAWLLDVRFEGERAFDPNVATRAVSPAPAAPRRGQRWGRDFHGTAGSGNARGTKSPACGASAAGYRKATRGSRS